jgi:hypothetical protein
MSFKSIAHLFPKQKHVYTAEHEDADWPNVPMNQPILSIGSGSYSEVGFGIYL